MAGAWGRAVAAAAAAGERICERRQGATSKAVGTRFEAGRFVEVPCASSDGASRCVENMRECVYPLFKRAYEYDVV